MVEDTRKPPTHSRYGDFWLFYLREHSKPLTRRLHYLGTSLVFAVAAWAALASDPRLLLLIPVAGYFFAWLGHFAVEKNRPATFKYPLWSLYSDFKMFFLWLSRGLHAELRNAGVLQNPKRGHQKDRPG